MRFDSDSTVDYRSISVPIRVSILVLTGVVGLFCWVGCGDSPPSNPGLDAQVEDGQAQLEPCTVPGMTECLNNGVRECVGPEGDSYWGPPEPCQPGYECREGQCVLSDPTAVQQEQIDLVNEYIDNVVFYTVMDPFRCDDGTGFPLEGQAVEPDLFVEQDPQDMAAGIDTQLEAAVELLAGP